MKDGLWVVILVVAIFMGFLMGYSLPPMYEVGMIGGKAEQGMGVKSGVDEDMQQYYQELQQQSE